MHIRLTHRAVILHGAACELHAASVIVRSTQNHEVNATWTRVGIESICIGPHRLLHRPLTLRYSVPQLSPVRYHLARVRYEFPIRFSYDFRVDFFAEDFDLKNPHLAPTTRCYNAS